MNPIDKIKEETVVQRVERKKVTYKKQERWPFSWWLKASEAFMGEEIHIHSSTKPAKVFLNDVEIWPNNDAS